MAQIRHILSQRETETIELTLTEFHERYYLHDSTIEDIQYNAENKTLTLTIDFCFWMQEWYPANTPPNGLIEVVFENARYYSYEDYDSSKLFGDCTPEILQTEIDDDTLILYTFEFVQYEPGKDLYPTMKIKADNVTVRNLNQ